MAFSIFIKNRENSFFISRAYKNKLFFTGKVLIFNRRDGVRAIFKEKEKFIKVCAFKRIGAAYFCSNKAIFTIDKNFDLFCANLFNIYALQCC